MRPVLPAIVAASLAAVPVVAARAADVDDIRLVGGYTWQRFHTDSATTITVGGVSGDFSGTDSGSEDQHWRAGGEWIASLHELAPGGSPIIGVALSYQHGEVADPGSTAAERTDGLVLDLLPGWAVPLDEGLHLEACAVAGVAWERESFHFGSAIVSGEDSDASIGYEFGARLGLHWTSQSRWQVGVVAEYLWGRVDHAFTVTDAARSSSLTADVRGRTDGFSAFAALGYRLP